VKALAGRYLAQMIDELKALPTRRSRRLAPGHHRPVVPHQANKTMVVDLAAKAGLPEESLYFNIDKVGNASSASIGLAIHDAVRDGVISKPVRIFAPGFGAGAVAGFSVMRVDPAVVAVTDPADVEDAAGPDLAAQPESRRPPSPDDVSLAFG